MDKEKLLLNAIKDALDHLYGIDLEELTRAEKSILAGLKRAQREYKKLKRSK